MQNKQLRCSGGLRAVSRRLERWRARHGGRGRRIPNELWLEAASVASADGVCETARALRLDRDRLGVLVSELATRPDGGEEEAGGFVELEVGSVLRGQRCVVQVVSRGGDFFRFETESDAVDLVALARAFLGTGQR